MSKKVFVSGCYDLLHSGHVEFFKQASQYGDLYVGIGSDKTYLEYKHRKPMFPQEERLFMVKSIRYVKDAYINEGSGVIDFLSTLDLVQPDVFVVNAEGGSDDGNLQGFRQEEPGPPLLGQSAQAASRGADLA